MNRTRYMIDEVTRNAFYQLPQFLFEGDFTKLGNDARVLYSLLRNRHDLSVKNGWVNEAGEVYLIFSREKMSKMLGLSDKTVTKAMTELKKYNLVEEQRQGQGKPNLIYLLTVTNVDISKTRNSYDSETGDFTVQDSENLRPSYTNINNTDVKSNLISSNRFTVDEEKEKTDTIREDEKQARTHDSEAKDTTRKKEGLPVSAAPTKAQDISKPSINDNYTIAAENVKEQIDYDILIEDGYSEETLDGLVQIIASTLIADYKDGYISMGDERIPAEAVKSVFHKLDMFDIQYFFECYNQQTGTIKKFTPYVRTSLYRNHGTAQLYYTNRVHVDMPYLAARR